MEKHKHDWEILCEGKMIRCKLCKKVSYPKKCLIGNRKKRTGFGICKINKLESPLRVIPKHKNLIKKVEIKEVQNINPMAY